jgi:hypothetical protein
MAREAGQAGGAGSDHRQGRELRRRGRKLGDYALAAASLEAGHQNAGRPASNEPPPPPQTGGRARPPPLVAATAATSKEPHRRKAACPRAKDAAPGAASKTGRSHENTYRQPVICEFAQARRKIAALHELNEIEIIC